MSHPSTQIIQLAQNGDRRAIEQLITTIQPTVRRQLTRYPLSEEDRADLLQSTLLQVLRRISSFRGESSFSTWLFRVTANEALMLMRTHRRHKLRLVDKLGVDELDTMRHNSNPIEEPFSEAFERADQVRKAVAALPESYQVVVAAHYTQSLGLEEIAQRFNMSEASVRSRLHRARARLRTVLSDDRVAAA